MLEAAELLAEARASAQHGEWATWLTATSTSPDIAERLLAIAARARTDRQFADAVQQDFFGGVSVAALVARAPDAVRAAVLEQPTAPPRREVERQIREAKIRTGAESQPATAALPQLPAPAPGPLDTLRTEAAGYGLVVDVADAGVVVHWPDEDPSAFSRVSVAEARAWIAEDASAALAERLRSGPATPQSLAEQIRFADDFELRLVIHTTLSTIVTHGAPPIALIGFDQALLAAVRAWAKEEAS